MRFRTILSISFIVFMALSLAECLYSQTSHPGDALAERARQEFQDQHYKAAEQDFRALTERDPSNIYAHLFLNECLFRQQKYAAAVVPYEKARALDRSSKLFSVDQKRILGDQLAMAYGLSGQLDKARALLEEAIRHDPDYALNYYNLACAFAESGDEEKMLKYLSLAFEHKEHTLTGEHLPDPRTDASFSKYLKDEQFKKLMDALGYK